jgi:putative chitinase
MAILREGARGNLVIQLQTALKAHGFDPGGIDGGFGPNTTAAVKAFQGSAGLQVDGIAGPATFGALGLDLAPATTGPSVTGSVTVAIVSKMFPGTPVGNITTNLPFVLSALDSFNLGDKDMVLMALGTIRAETGSFKPISEGISKFNTTPGGHPFDRYDNRKDLGNQGPPDGASFKGRGFVQLTGRANYTKFSAELGLGNQLVTNPDLGNDPTIAGRLLAVFLKDKETQIRAALSNRDLALARKLVNGGSHGLSAFVDTFTIGEGLID